MPNYDLKCVECSREFIQYSKVDNRGDILCECGGATKILVPKKIAVVYRTDGFVAQEIAHERHQRLIEDAMNEGYVSKTEMEVGAEQALARASKLGIPPERLLGKEVYENNSVGDFAESLEEAMS